MILEIDIGNSRLKWRCVKASAKALPLGNKILASGVVEHSGIFDFSLPVDSAISEVWVANVLTGQESCIKQWSTAEFGVAPEFVRTDKCLSGVTNRYDDITQMGVDRWLAMVAAYQILGEVIVVDCGSACTIDIVSSTGHHQGGYILPGFTLMKRHLMTKMKRAIEPASLPVSTSPGHSTVSALDAGLVNMLVGAIEQVQQQFADSPWLFTGGDGLWLLERVQPKLTAPATFCESLVLDGLFIKRLVSKLGA